MYLGQRVIVMILTASILSGLSACSTFPSPNVAAVPKWDNYSEAGQAAIVALKGDGFNASAVKLSAIVEWNKKKREDAKKNLAGPALAAAKIKPVDDKRREQQCQLLDSERQAHYDRLAASHFTATGNVTSILAALNRGADYHSDRRLAVTGFGILSGVAAAALTVASPANGVWIAALAASSSGTVMYMNQEALEGLARTSFGAVHQKYWNNVSPAMTLSADKLGDLHAAICGTETEWKVATGPATAAVFKFLGESVYVPWREASDESERFDALEAQLAELLNQATKSQDSKASQVADDKRTVITLKLTDITDGKVFTVPDFSFYPFDSLSPAATSNSADKSINVIFDGTNEVILTDIPEDPAGSTTPGKLLRGQEAAMIRFIGKHGLGAGGKIVIERIEDRVYRIKPE